MLRQFAPSSGPVATSRAGAHRPAVRRNISLPALLISASLLLPYSVAIYLGDLKLTPIKILIVSLAVPAGIKLIHSAAAGKRRLLAADGYALAVFLLMSLGPIAISGTRDFVSAFSQAIEFYGMYIVARAYIFELSAVDDFVCGLQVATIVVVVFGALDIISQRYVAWDLTNLFFPSSGGELDISESKFHRTVMGFNSLRATSTLDHPILFGSFCATVLPLYLYAPMSAVRRCFLVAACLSGCFMALSSAPMLACLTALVILCYDGLLKSYRWRWKVLLSTVATCIVAFSLASDNPMSWLFRNLTLDPQTGYFRLLIWDAALNVIGENPLIGLGFNPTGDRILDASTDCLLLAKAIIYGLPMVGLLYLTATSAMVPVRGERAARKHAPRLNSYCTAFSLSLSIFMFISMTVTFWNALWLMFALFIGVRVSLKEQCLCARRALSKRIA